MQHFLQVSDEGGLGAGAVCRGAGGPASEQSAHFDHGERSVRARLAKSKLEVDTLSRLKPKPKPGTHRHPCCGVK